ncbi:MAG: hypothetical protein FWF53_09185 [Candidatus Azobacteroides sp.]|nr:hypothetical protein [Candidatus Azobacteroides sp.]
MEQENKKIPAPIEYVAEKVAELTTVFYETPEALFEVLAKEILRIGFTEKEVAEMVEEAVLTVRKTKITIADIVYERYTQKKQSNVTITYI